MCCASLFRTGGGGSCGQQIQAKSNGTQSKMLAQGNNLRVRDEGGGRGRSSTWNKKTRTASTCWISPGQQAETWGFGDVVTDWLRTMPVPERGKPGTIKRRFNFSPAPLTDPCRPKPNFSGLQKGPAETGHVQKRQKLSKIILTFFDSFHTGKKRQNRQRVSNISFDTFDNFRAAPLFRPLLAGSENCFECTALAKSEPRRRIISN